MPAHLCITRAVRVAALTLLVVAGCARAAVADVTAFVGLTPTPDTRMVKGFSAGFGLLFVAFEGEYATVSEDPSALSPSLRTWSGNALAQTPIEVSGISLYGTAGAGVYREALLDARETSTAVNIGGGAKIRIAGPLRIRLDYRVFKLQGSPLHPTYQRFYAGANLGF